MPKPQVVLDDWYIEVVGVENHSKTLRPTYQYVLRGVIGKGHPYLRAGDFIHTSLVKSIDFEIGVCETLNTLYLLGKPSGM
jgi:hypothetical protein